MKPIIINNDANLPDDFREDIERRFDEKPETISFMCNSVGSLLLICKCKTCHKIGMHKMSAMDIGYMIVNPVSIKYECKKAHMTTFKQYEYLPALADGIIATYESVNAIEEKIQATIGGLLDGLVDGSDISEILHGLVDGLEDDSDKEPPKFVKFYPFVEP